MVKSYEQWVDAVEKEYEELVRHYIYLNEEGKRRMQVFGSLMNLAVFCSNARELHYWIFEDQKARDDEDFRNALDPQARMAMRQLKRLSDQML